MPRKQLLKGIQSIVVKIGTSTITDAGAISPKKMGRIAADVSNLRANGYRVVLVSSGAIAAGATTLERDRKTLSIPEKQACAALGQTILMNEWRKVFQKYDLHVGQILLTEDDVKNRHRFLNARYTLETLLDLGIIPIVNENDSVVVKEIKFGDNDTLSAHVATLIDAGLLVLLSDIDGFYLDLSDPAPVDEISGITTTIWEKAGGAGSDHGTGGMVTKIRAAEIMIRFGEKMVIARGSEPQVLTRIMAGDRIGTIFTSRSKPLPSRKKWLAISKPRGTVSVDDGAAEAIQARKKSLLASGIIGVTGPFSMGDVVEITDLHGTRIGKGIVNYNSHELDAIKGLKTGEIRRRLEGSFYEEVINRDDLILL